MKISVAALVVIVCVVYACHLRNKPDKTEEPEPKPEPPVWMASSVSYANIPIEKLRKTLVIGVHGFNKYSFAKLLDKLSNFLQFIKSGVLFKNGVTPIFPTTPVPNLCAVSTGLYAEDHGVVAYKFRDPDSDNEWLDVENPVAKIFQGEPIWETLRKNDLKAACLNWPGCDFGEFDEGHFVKDGKLSWKDSMTHVKKWLEDTSVQLVMMSYSGLSEIEREFGGEWSSKLEKWLKQFDKDIGQMMADLEKKDPERKLNIIIVGTNGVANIERDQEILFKPIERPTLVVPKYEVWAQEGAVWLVQPVDGSTTDDVIKHFAKIGEMKANVWRKADVPASYHYQNSPRIPEVIISAHLGSRLYTENGRKQGEKSGDGYNPDYVPAVLLASGRAIKPESKTYTYQDMVNVHLLLCKILGVEPPAGHKGEPKKFEEFLQDQFLNPVGSGERLEDGMDGSA